MEPYVFELYVTGENPKTTEVVSTVRDLCEEKLDEYDLEIINVYKNPTRAEKEKVWATPTLIRIKPEPIERVIGDFPDREELARVLELI